MWDWVSQNSGEIAGAAIGTFAGFLASRIFVWIDNRDNRKRVRALVRREVGSNRNVVARCSHTLNFEGCRNNPLDPLEVATEWVIGSPPGFTHSSLNIYVAQYPDALSTHEMEALFALDGELCAINSLWRVLREAYIFDEKFKTSETIMTGDLFLNQPFRPHSAEELPRSIDLTWSRLETHVTSAKIKSEEFLLMFK